MRMIFRSFKKAVRARQSSREWILFIMNPASGQSNPNLRLLNRLIKQAGMEWEMVVTNTFGDGERAARDAVNRGVKTVAVYGGDGTIMDAAKGLLDSDVPLAILPGGTGNALAKELLVPIDFKTACELMLSPNASVRKIDLAAANEHLFCLRLGVGMEAEIVKAADRAQKDRIGALAYVSAAVQAWNQGKISHYTLILDGQTEEIDGLACMVANAATLGIQGITISPDVNIQDGLLDVFVIRKADLAELTSIIASVTGNQALTASHLPHWRCRELSIDSDPQGGVEADGEELGSTPVRIMILPAALNVIMP